MEIKVNTKKIFIIVGERSGDLHGSNLVFELMKHNPNVNIQGWGGDLMKAAGVNITMHYRSLAFMGFWEVAKNIFTINALIRRCKAEIVEFNPHAVILIDYAGFNMKIAQFVRKKNITVFYYIPPKVWAWNSSRAYKLTKYTDKVFSILPFEVPFFKMYGVNIEYVGNPLMDAIRNHSFSDIDGDFHHFKDIVAILPGSRLQEVTQMINELSISVDQMKNVMFLVAGVDNLDPSVYDAISNKKNVKLLFNQTYDILNISRAAVVASGTATLETALLNIPQIVCYRTSFITYAIAKRLINVKYISLVNLIADEAIVPELIQSDFTADKIVLELNLLLNNQNTRSRQLMGYEKVVQLLTDKSASETTALALNKFLSCS